MDAVPTARGRASWACRRWAGGRGFGTVVAQLSVPNKTALRKSFTQSNLRRAVLDERRGQDSNLRTSCPVTDLANPRFRPLSHLSDLCHASSTSRVQEVFLCLQEYQIAAKRQAQEASLWSSGWRTAFAETAMGGMFRAWVLVHPIATSSRMNRTWRPTCCQGEDSGKSSRLWQATSSPSARRRVAFS